MSELFFILNNNLAMDSTTNVWNKFHENVHNFVRKRVDVDADIDDIVQEVFVRIHLKKESVKDDAKLQSWIYQVTRNTIADFYRQKQKEGYKQDETPDIEDQDVGFYGKQEMFCCLHPFVDELPDKYREALKMSDLEGKKQQEVADTLGISLSGAKSRIQRAREILKTKFVACCNFTLNEEGELVGEQDCARCNP